METNWLGLHGVSKAFANSTKTNGYIHCKTASENFMYELQKVLTVNNR